MAPNFVAVLQSQRLLINARKRLATRRRLICNSKNEFQQLESPLTCLRREEGAQAAQKIGRSVASCLIFRVVASVVRSLNKIL